MKKLMKAVAAAAVALVASSSFATIQSTAGFENFQAGALTIGDLVSSTDGDDEDSNRYWFAITNDSVAATETVGTITEKTTGNNYLALEAQAPLYRTVNPSGDTGTELSATPQEIGGGIYLDTMVKFTISQDEFKDGDLENNVDKLAITCYSAEESTDTNILVRAGYVTASAITPTNYFLNLPEGFNADNWYRLTVRAIANTGSTVAPVGFAIYINGELLEYDAAQAAGISDYEDDIAGNSTIATYLYNSQKHAFLPSLVNGEYNTATTQSAVGFKGTGGIDNIAFLDTKPSVLPDEGILVTVDSDEGVSAVTITVGQEEITGENGVYTLAAGTSAFNLDVTWNEAQGYTSGTIMAGETQITTREVNVSGDMTITIKGLRNNFTFVDGNGDSVAASTLTDAFDRVGDGETITLAYDYDVTSEGESTVYEISGKDVTLDLNGKTITGGASTEDALFTVSAGASLTVIDTVGGGKIADATTYGIFLVDGDVFVGSDDATDKGVTIDGILASTEGESDITVVRGSFDAANNSTVGGAFAWSAAIAPDSSCSAAPENGYWVVAPGEAPATFALTTTGGANATVTTAPADVSALTEATSVTITATANADYTYFGVNLSGTDWTYSSANDAITLTLTVSDDTEVAVPNAVEKTAWAKVLGNAVDGAYEIDSLAELKDFQANVGTLPTSNETFKLTTDITLVEAWPGIGIQNGKDIYTTAEFDEGAFCGTFDGQNHTISGFQMIGKGDKAEGLDYCGFFNSTYGATIQNLKIAYKEGKFAADTTASTKESGATFVGVAKKSTLRNLTTVAGTVSCSKGFGGIVGYLTSGTLVDSCTNNVNMTSLANNKCGGIAMIAQGGSAVTIQNCQNNGTQTTGSSNSEYGAIVGYVGLGITIENCETTVGRFLKHQDNTVTLQGVNKGDATVLAYHGAATPGLNFATVDNGVATFVADNALALNGSYKVVGPSATATFVFAEAGTIAFDQALATPTYAITAAEGLTLSDPVTVGSVVTYTATVPGPVTPTIDPANPAAVEVKAESAAAAIEAVALETPTDVDAADYKALFDFTATETSAGSGVYNVSIAGIKETVEEAVEESAMAVLNGLLGASVRVPAGLYYKVTTYTALGSEAVETKSDQSDGKGVSVAKPGTTQGFIKIEMATVPFN